MSFLSRFVIKAKGALPDFFKLSLPLLFVFYLLRLFEFFTSALKLELKQDLWLLELKACLYDTLFYLHLCAFLFFVYLLVYFLRAGFARILLLIINMFVVVVYFSLLIVFTERLAPFDHEVFMRAPAEAISTITTEIGGKLILISPLPLFLFVYYFSCRYFLHKKRISNYTAGTFVFLALISLLALKLSKQEHRQYKSVTDYNLSVNKLRYFVADCYDYLVHERNKDWLGVDDTEIAKQIELYQQLNKHPYTNAEFPLLRYDDSRNVLADFLNIGDTVPNIVVVIYEGLSSDFSGKAAPSGSFTPFLDSLAQNSLSWYNCLSSAQGTFGALPSIVGSLPFGERGFTLLLDPPEHLSLVKILKKNHWQTNFMVGAEPNFDNYAGFLRMQGIDHVSSFHGKKYKKMGVDASNWTIGYPDKALFNKSFEDLDSIARTPYLSMYLTLTTHTPFIFDELHQYEKRFDRLVDSRKLSKAKRMQMNIYRQMFASFLYSDDCLRSFFDKYKKRPEYRNTIFVITGDHHHGFFPTRNAIDDYNVPLIIYSPLLKRAENFQSVNSHFNIAPTLLSLLKNSYHLKVCPQSVAWIGDVLDTCKTFRNIHHIPFILSNRNIEDYLYEDYYLADGLYKIRPGLHLEPVDNPKELDRMKKIRDNFKFINAYVCKKNKLFPFAMNTFERNKTKLYSFKQDRETQVSAKTDTIEFVHAYQPPAGYRHVMVRVSFSIKYKVENLELLPRVQVETYDPFNKKKLLSQYKDARDHINEDPGTATWVRYAEEDVYNTIIMGSDQAGVFRFSLKNQGSIDFTVKDLVVDFLGID